MAESHMEIPFLSDVLILGKEYVERSRLEVVVALGFAPNVYRIIELSRFPWKSYVVSREIFNE